MDTCKVVREKLDKPLFTFPTIGSNCAASTSIAVIYHPDGSVNNYFYGIEPADHIFINTKMMKDQEEAERLNYLADQLIATGKELKETTYDAVLKGIRP